MAPSESTTAAVAHHTTASSATKSSSSTSSSAASLATQSSQPSSSPLPTPFDQGFAGNITETCSNFVYGFLADSTFTSCLPFSLLLQNSESFFQAEKSVLSISQTLDATCAANVNTCTDYMNGLSGNLTKACTSDITAKNPAILQAQLGLNAYKTLYTASCLRNPSTSAYCFADAITNASSPSDSYIYYLPLNVSFPGGSAPTCSTCLVNTMAVLEEATSDRNSPIASDYADAAQQINLHCGPGFVNTSLAAVSSPSMAGRPNIPAAELALVVVLGALIFGGF
ncbi:hypothetical protein OIDMADRAFT_172233 [Oidiodendron maius Zn]|uniref:DUF7729 domain-containing protein n=1 Tax=Oidiodendron maius (strain Zn) TaxID=913774 RepID=A0A0C3GG41_OIDMZ|nr:hypothetical protein OIDMADRAFT_172233 [Oidiodendron maius Zn]